MAIHFKFIDELKSSDPRRRQKLLLGMHEKNVKFLRTLNPQMSEFIAGHGTGSFEIRLTDRFLEILDRSGSKEYHPPGKLLEYMTDLGAWHHSAWIDKVMPMHIGRGETEHGQLVGGLVRKIYAAIPDLGTHIRQSGEVSLPRLPDGMRYSGPVVFLGVFPGLHIMVYLNRTRVRDLFLIEPDLDRFALSCYFLDFEKINSLVGRLLLHVGPDAPQSPIDMLINRAPVTASAWVRLLPAYEDEKFDDILNRVGLRWRSLMEIFVPFDRELRNLKYGLTNVLDRRPLPVARPQLSPGSVIAIVASGPSLADDLEWLSTNQDRLIIMASISCMRVLKERGIRVDYQCTLDTEIDEPLLEKLDLDPEVALVAYYKLDPSIVKKFRKVLLLPEEGKANPVRFLTHITNTHPTTGNFATAFACWCRPATILLVGLDLGFRDARRSHVEGGWHDEDEGAGHDDETAGRDHIKARANFPESEGQILTLAYYNTARIYIEGALASLPESVKVYNLADGVKVARADPMRSADLVLEPYPDKPADLETIEGAFGTEAEKIWVPYSVSGEAVLRETFAAVLDRVKLPGAFEWKAWAEGLDQAWELAALSYSRKYKEWRLEIYAMVLHDLLAEWYRCAVLARTPEEAKLVYSVGLEELDRVLHDLKWPAELDELTTPGAESMNSSTG